MKFLVTGSTGLVGYQIVKDLIKDSHTVYSCYNNLISRDGIPIKLNLTNQNDIENCFKKIQPDVVIHLAAITDVDLCERQQDLAMKINAISTETLAKESSKQNSFFIYMSTDYIFDGKQGMKKENDVPNPLGFYGQSKLTGELSLNKLASSYSIVRISSPFGHHPIKKSFPSWVIENLKQKNKIPILTDQITSPTYVPNLSKMLIEIAVRQIIGKIHLAGSTRISRYNFANIIAEKLNLDNTLLIPTKLEDMNWHASRPKDSSLDVSFATEILNEKPQTIHQSLDSFLSKL